MVKKYKIIDKCNKNWYNNFGQFIKFGTSRDKLKPFTNLIGKWCVDDNDPEYPIYCSCCHTHFSDKMIGLDIDGDVLCLTHCPICDCSMKVSYVDLRSVFKYKGKTQQQYLYEDYRNKNPKYHELLVQIEVSKRNSIRYNTIENLLDWNNRENWYEQFSPMIFEVDYKNRTSRISENGGVDYENLFAFDKDIEYYNFYDDLWYHFIPEELKMNYHWKFKIGDIVTDGKEIMVIRELPDIHPENKNYNRLRVQFNGNSYWVAILDENCECKFKDDPIGYCYFHEGQLQKVDFDTECIWKIKLNGKEICGRKFNYELNKTTGEFEYV